MLATLLFAGHASRLYGQVEPAAKGPRQTIAVGGAVAGFRSSYGQQNVAGFTLYSDVNLSTRLGMEGEARFLRFHTQEQTHSSTYLIGPRIVIPRGRFRFYGKFLVGAGDFTFPFNYAQGSYLVIAPGAGLDMRILQGRASIRLLDFEYQDWHDFTFGSMHPYGLSSGVSFRIF